ncbi:putative negative regulator of RcsB-dependent stress response [Rhodoferax ferrireducens]|uniref:Ancillary SecYEG translocon subunit n=1 Tax=Rhodoferax ferrireducens TaxID=192843 RepID=A0ABU2C622_9BURK|nr:tetratricopeptide repeat protein [Rhodoferax ferrireducens]MDR7376782.1 putative negative regulator of RcsB-dependent stress response [Rhodoferax ferrireducens]
MANHLDLEEQEQLDELKAFWNRFGNLITWILIVVLAGFAGWNGYQYWQRSQAAQAAALYDEVDRASKAGDVAKVERAFSDMKDKYGRTTFAQQAGLLAAKTLFEKGNADAAKAALTWVADQSSDEGYQAVARLRLAGVLLEAKSYDEALKLLSGSFGKEFEPLVADRKGDVYALQDKKADAIAQYQIAYKGLDAQDDYQRIVEVKLNSLGVDPRPAAPVVTVASPVTVEVKK